MVIIMGKRITIALLSSALILSLAACNLSDPGEVTDTTDASDIADTTEAPETTAPAIEIDEIELDIEKFVISRDNSIMEGWPDLIRTASGRLLVIYNECTSHGNRDHTFITLRYSDDNGESWSEKQYIGEETFSGNHYNSIRMNQLSDGRIVVLCDRIYEQETNPKTELHMWVSTDDGETWSETRETGIYGYCSDKIREMPDGSYLICVSRYNEDIERTEIIAHKSYDKGATWTSGVVAASSEVYTLIEPAVLTLSDGKLCVFMRENSLKGYNGFVVYSDDCGESFYGLSEIPVEGMHRPFVGKLDNGLIFLSYREYLQPKIGPDGKAVGTAADLKACLFTEEELYSAEEFKTYLIDHDNASVPDQGYSAWVELEDGKMIMVNYIVDNAPKPFIRGYKISMATQNG